MKRVIILSAGQGSRLGPMTYERPKFLIEFAGRTLLDRQLDTLDTCGVEEAVVVTGFRDRDVETAIARRSGGVQVRTVFNPFYKVADNTGSLWLAREALDGDVLVWNGDTMVSDSLMRRVVTNACDGICVTVDRKVAYDADDMKVITADDGRLMAIGKRLEVGVNAESIGLLAFRGAGAATFRTAIDSAMRTAEGTTIWYLRVIHHLAQSGEVRTLDIQGEEWGEVDFPEDVERAEAMVQGWAAQ